MSKASIFYVNFKCFGKFKSFPWFQGLTRFRPNQSLFLAHVIPSSPALALIACKSFSESAWKSSPSFSSQSLTAFSKICLIPAFLRHFLLASTHPFGQFARLKNDYELFFIWCSDSEHLSLQFPLMCFIQ